MIGRGRLGSALAARLANGGVVLSDEDVDLVLLCVPDRHIAEVAASVAPGPWVAHVSGAAPLASLAPHARRFSLHPLQTFDRSGRAEQFDGTWAAVTAESEAADAAGVSLAQLLGVRPFRLNDDARIRYHAGAAIASNYLVTLFDSASALLRSAGAPPEALIPLMQRTIENGFQRTGPIARGDWATVDAHRHALRTHAPEFLAMYDVLAEVTAR